MHFNTHTFAHMYYELLRAAANLRNCIYVYNYIPIFEGSA